MTASTQPWRVPQLLRDLKPQRPGVPEVIEAMPAYLALPLLVGKCHAELYEVSDAPDDAEEYGDLLEALSALSKAVGHGEPVPAAVRGDGGCGAGAIHRAIEGFARDLNDADGPCRIARMVYDLAAARGIKAGVVDEARRIKGASLGGFDRHLLWRRTDTPDAVDAAKGYVPELGQALFGQPSKSFAVPTLMEAVLSAVSQEYDRVYWNFKQQDCPSPFSNSGTSLVTPVFEVHAYSWGDEEQPFNFKWRDLEISWYKRCGRGMSTNMPITPSLAEKCLEECLEAVRAMEGDDGDGSDVTLFTDLT